MVGHTGIALQVPWVKRMGHNYSACEAYCNLTQMEIRACDDRRIDEAHQEQRQGEDVAEEGLSMEHGGGQVLGACLVAGDELAIGECELGLSSSGKL